jgi:hypothetical protein
VDRSRSRSKPLEVKNRDWTGLSITRSANNYWVVIDKMNHDMNHTKISISLNHMWSVDSTSAHLYQKCCNVNGMVACISCESQIYRLHYFLSPCMCACKTLLFVNSLVIKIQYISSCKNASSTSQLHQMPPCILCILL